MKKPTILRTLIFVVALLFNFASYSQNWMAYSPKFTGNLNENIFLKANNQFENPVSLNTNEDNGVGKTAAPLVNPAIKYAQAPYLGTISTCPNDGKKLPKLFLCGNNETRKIETGLVDAQSIIWEKFTAGGSCLNVSNTNCANETAAASCWTQVGNTPDYIASTAGQFRVKIVDNAGDPYTFYFNVYQNTLDPGAIAKNDIIKYGTSCTINGKITVNGFGSGYEYGLTTTSSPPSSWQPSNVFNVTTPGNYNVFIRLSGVAGSCDFKVPNIVISQRDFVVTTQVSSPKCSGELGSIDVVATDINLQYVYKLTGPTTITVPATSVPNYTFSGLASGTYTVETSVVGSTCMKDTKSNIVIVASPNVLTNTSTRTKNLTVCNTGEITGSATGGVTPYRYSINIDNTGFVNVANVDNLITVARAGSYVVRVEDGNGCIADKTIIIGDVTKPVYNITKVDGNCTGASGSISVNITNANGYTDIQYSKDNGTNFQAGNTFPNLPPGIYYVVVKYRIAGVNGGNYCTDPAIMTNVGAATPLSASAGIAALSGCGPASDPLQGLARIVNPQGGVPFSGPYPYKYSFDNGVNWQDSNEAYINPGGPYTFKIKDAVGCIFDMPGITLDPKPAAPTIKILDPVFNCDGSATTTVEVNGGVPDPKYSYKYYKDGFLNNNTPPNIFLNVEEGKHTITVEYTVLNVSTYSNLLVENFGSGGTTTTPGIAGTYCFNDQRVNPPYTCSLNGTPTRSVEDNQYSVANDFWRSDDYDNRGRWVGNGAWYHFKDHTTTGTDAQGRFLLINIGKAAGDYGVLYSKDIVDVIPGQPVMIDLYVANLLKSGVDGAAPILIFELVDQTGRVVATDRTGKIAENKNDPDRNKWIKKALSLDPGPNTKLTFKIRSGSTDYGGNDLVMDDIWVRQVPKACGTVQDFDINIDPAKNFSADITGVKDVLCFGDTNGEITITARNFDPAKGFQYSMNDGAAGSWVTVTPVPAASTGSVTVKNLASKTYLIKVRYEAIATSCTIPFSQEVKQPAVLDVSAVIFKPATCTDGATIRASAIGGTPAYEFELRDSSGTMIIKPRQSGTDFVNIPKGTYVVRGYDKNACVDNINTTIEVKEPDPIDAVLASTSNLCYTAANKASITVTVNGGTAPFTYSLNGAAAQDDNTFINLGPGSYVITVTDKNNCTDDTPAIVIDDELIVTSSVTQTLKCAIAPAVSSGVITGEIKGGKAAYTVVRLTGPGTGTIAYPTPDTFTFTGTVPGLYTFEITDSKGCKTTTSATIQSLTNPTVTAAPENPKCFGAATGSVVLSASGGSGSGYEYKFNGGIFKPDATYSGLSANIKYTYQVKDGNGCLSVIKDFTLTEPTELKGDIKATEIECSGSGTKAAIVTVTGTGGTGPYEYSFNNDTSFSTTNTFPMSVAGDVIAYVRDKNGCKIVLPQISIAALNQITGITITDNGYDCSTTPPGGHVNIAAIKAGVSAPIRYKIVSGPAGYNTAQNSDGEFKSLTPGDYIFRALDIKTGCYFDMPYTVKGAPDIVAGGSVVTAIKCFGGTGKIEFTVNGVKDRGYDYVITNGSGTIIQQGNNVPETTTTITVAAALPKGVYTIKAIDNKTKCEATYAVTLTEPAAALAVSATASKINCSNGKSDITVTVLGGTPNYTYAVAVPGPAPTTFGPSAVLTVDTNSGANLKWIVYVKDANGCDGQFTVDIEKEATPTVTAVLDNQCSATGTGNIFTITATGSSGVAPLKYSIDGINFQLGQTFNVPAGTYTVTVQDKNGCIATAPAAIVVSSKLTAVATVTKELDCSATPDAEITVTINGGKGPYKYTIQKGTGTPGTQATTAAGPIVLPVAAAQADKYTFAIIDANGCSISVDATVKTISNPAVAVKSFENPSCNGGANGSITLEATGGSGSGYKYSLDNSAFTTDTYYPNLSAGLHQYKIIDGNGCPASGSFTLTAPSQLVVTVVEKQFTCDTNNGKVAGTVTLNVTAGTGTGPYQYSFNGGGSSALNVLTLNDTGAPQNYTYTVTDDKGCSVSGSGTLSKLNPPKIFEIKGTPIYCKPATSTVSTVTVTTTPLTGALPLSYVITAPASQVGNTSGATTGVFSNLPAGPTGTLYSFRVTDNNGCYADGTYRVEPAINIGLTATISNNVYCKGGSTGTIKMDVTGFTGTYKYSVNGVETTGQNLTTISLTGLSQGSYNIIVTDEVTGCEATALLTITEPVKVLSAVVVQKNANCTVTTSNVTVTPDGGTPNYKYAFVTRGTDPSSSYGPSNSADLSATPTADWDVWVKDANNCTFKTEITLATDARPTVTASAVGECLGDGTAYTITATGSGVGPFKYSINNGASYQTGNTFTVTTDGTYHITVIDANGCTSVAAADVIVAPKLTLDPVLDKNITCLVGNEAAKVTLTTGGGTPGYTYTSSPTTGTFSGPLGNIFTTTTPGTYTFTVTDAKGCTVTSPVTIDVKNATIPVITSATPTDILCNGSSSGSIAVVYDNSQGVGPFVINIKQYLDAAHTGTPKDFGTQTSGLPAGYYLVTLTDSYGCSASESVRIKEPDPIVISFTPTPLKCNGSGVTQGKITINSVTGGTPNYTYTVTGINNYYKQITNQTGGSAVFEVVDFGLYQIRVDGQNGCAPGVIEDVLIAAPVDELKIDVSLAATCAGGSATVKILSAFAGTGGFHFNIYNGLVQTWLPGAANVATNIANGWLDENPANSKSTVFTGLTPGKTYSFIVYDESTQCYYFQSADGPIPTNSTLEIKNWVPQNITCKGFNNGNVSFDIKNPYATNVDIKYEIFNAFTNITTGNTGTRTILAGDTAIINPAATTPLPVGTYYVLITETSGVNVGCGISSPNFNIKESTSMLLVDASVSNKANCNPLSGTIIAVANGGTPFVPVLPAVGPAYYKYMLLLATDTAPTDINDTRWVTNNTFFANAGNYIVYALDAYGCIQFDGVVLDKYTDPGITAPAAICYDGSTPFTFKIVGSVDPLIPDAPTYSANGGSTFQIDPNFTFNAAGTYKLVVKDGNGCTATTDFYVYPPLKLDVKRNKGLDCSPTPNATIELTASGGTLPTPTYTYEYSTNNGVLYTPITLLAGNIFEATAAGDYIFRLTDTANPKLCQVTNTLKIDPIPAIVFTTAETNLSCFESDNGTIKVTVTSGVGPFKYTLTDGVTTWGPQDSSEFKNLKANVAATPSYTVTVRDGTLCTLQKTGIILTQPKTLAATPTVAPYNCDPVTNDKKPAVVTVTVDPTTGTAPYRYKFGSATVYDDVNTLTVNSLSLQNIAYSVIDANDCVVSGTIPVAPYVKLTALNIVSATPITCDPLYFESDVTIQAVGGYPGYTYEIVAPASETGNITGQTNGVFLGLKSGLTYRFKATDTNGCSIENTHKVEPVVNITVSGANVNNVSCNTTPAGSNGTVAFTIANFTGAYTYTLSTALGTVTKTVHTGYDVITVADLPVGTYQIDIVDSVTSCVSSATADVSQPVDPLAIAITSYKNANCDFGVKVVVKAEGGTLDYKYAFAANGAAPNYTTNPTANSATLDPSKTWIAWVQDKNNCDAQVAIPMITDPNPTIDSVSSVCYKVGEGPVKITLTGTVATGTGAPRFNIGNGWTYNDTFELNAPGPYTFSIMDGNGCVSTTPFNYTLDQELLLTADKKSDITCKAGAAGLAVIDLKATQGSLTYNTIEYSTDGTTFLPITSNPFTTSTAGTYTFRVTDSKGCQAVSKEVIVTDKTTPTFTYTKTDITCFGANNGSFKITPSDGLAPYTYSIDGGVTYPYTNNEFIGLTPAIYHVYVKDAKECVTNQDIEIIEPAQLTVNPVVTPFGCSPTNAPLDAVVTLNATFGTSPYSYSFDNGGTFSDINNTLTVHTAQTIKYVVVDKNGCRVSGDAVVNVYSAPHDMVLAATPIYCSTPGGVATVTVTSVAGPPAGTAYTYEITSPIAAAISNNNGIFPGLVPNTYKIKVTDDASHCYTVSSIEVKKAAEISVAVQTSNDVQCNGDNTGSVTFTVSNYITAGAYTYNLTPNPLAIVPVQVGDVITYSGLGTGTYSFHVSDNVSGCFDDVIDFVIDQPAKALDFTTVATDIDCIKKNAFITVTADVTTGTAPYKYAVLETGSTATPVYGDSNILEVNTNNGTILSWDVYVQDVNNCSLKKVQPIATAALPAGISIAPYSQCPDPVTKKYTFTVNVTSGVAPFTYSLNGVDFQTDNTFIVDNAGTYNVTVKDGNGCPALATVPVVITPKLTITHIIEVLPSCDERDGRITVSATGGSSSANYVYNLDDNGFPQTAPTYTYTNISSGAHFIEVTDTATGCKDRVSFTIKPATPIVGLTVTGTPVTCFGSTNGTITASITDGIVNDNPVYKYELFGTSKGSPIPDVSIPLQDSGNFINLKPGDYTVRVVSGRGCKDTKFFRVLEPEIITVGAPIPSQYGCTTGNKTNYATVTIDKTTINGGSGNYTRFQFIKTSNSNEIVYEGDSNVYTQSDFSGGKFIVNVFDDKGCIGTSTEVVIFPFISMDKIDVAITPITCAVNEDIAVTVKDFNGVTFTIPLEYKLDGVNGTVFTETNTDGLFTNLPIGHYLISVRNPATGCIILKDHFVNDPNTFDLKAENVTNIKCYGAADGSVDLVLVDNVPLPINEAGEFTYDITDASGNLVVQNGRSDATGKTTITGLLAGLYNVKATLSNKPFCPVETNFTIQQPIAELKIFETHDPISCIPGNDGKITISADGGWPGAYQYELVGVSAGYSAQSEFPNLGAGTYTLNVKDVGGCIATMPVTLSNPTPIVATATATASTLACHGDTSGVITVSAPTGGLGSKYTYILNMLSVTPVISTASQDSPIFTGLGAGKYSVTINDPLNCTGTTAEVTIDEPTEVVPTLELATGITCKTDATLKLSAVGGTGPYEYSSDKNFTTVLGTLPATFAIGLGDHQYFVRDAKGCVSSISNNVKIDPLTPLDLKLDLTNAVVYCKGSSTAAIDAEAVGGLTNYVYTLYDGSGALIRPAQPTGYFDLLPKGVYVVRVDSGDCQFNSASITIDEPAEVLSVIPTVTDATCFAANDGKISIAATGGTGVIKYAISPNLALFDDKFEFDRLAPGKYQVLVQDENSCFQLLDLEIKEPALLGAKVVGPILQEICDGDKDGAFSIDIFGGKPPYSVSLDNENGPYLPVTATQYDFTGLKGGTHTVYIKDASCISTVEVMMDNAVILNPTVEINYDCVNNAQTNMITVTVDQSNTDLTQVDYSLDSDVGPWQQANIFTNVAPGNHYIVTRHTNGCKVPTASFNIKAYDPLTLALSSGTQEMNVISVTAAGGAPAYEYSFNGEPFTSSNKYKIYKSGDYVVVVRDQNGCTATITVPAIYVDVCLDNYFTPSGATNTTWGPGCTNIYDNLEFSIFDRYGRVIAKYHYGQKWDGRYNGAELPSGDYWYVLKLNDEKDDREFVGHFTLYR